MFDRIRVQTMSEPALQRALHSLQGVYFETGDSGFPEPLREEVNAIRAELVRRQKRAQSSSNAASS